MSLGLDLAAAILQDLPRLTQLVHPRHEWKHDLEVPLDGGAQQSAELRAEDVRPAKAEADRPKPHDRVGLVLVEHLVEVLVSAKIEGADDRLLRRNSPCEAEVNGPVLLLRGKLRGAGEEQEFRAIETDPMRSLRGRGTDLL